MEIEESLNNLYKESLEELNSIGINLKDKNITIKISNRSKKRYGCCKPEIPDKDYKIIEQKGFKYIIKYQNYKKYTIEISDWVMNLDKSIIKNTIIHELIHCLPCCNNHGSQFKTCADIINKKLGYNISRVGNKKQDFEKSNLEYTEKEEYRYKIKCKNCNKIFYRKRLKKDFIKRYRCTCLGKLEITNI